jgi:hypothetical protein
MNRLRLVMLLLIPGILLLSRISSQPRGITQQRLAGSVKLRLVPDTNVYVWGQYGWLEVFVSNLRKEPIRIPNTNQQLSLLTLVITDQTGRTARPVSIPTLYGDLSQTLEPNEVIRESFQLDYYTNDTTRTSPGPTLLIGEYTVRAVLNDVTSETKTIRIRPPSSEERSVAEQITRELQPNRGLNAIENARRLLREYPNTVYLPNIYRVLLGELATSNDPVERSEELSRMSLEYLQKFQQSGEAKVAISYFGMAERNRLGVQHGAVLNPVQRETIKSRLQALKSRFPTERVSRYVEYTIGLL